MGKTLFIPSSLTLKISYDFTQNYIWPSLATNLIFKENNIPSQTSQPFVFNNCLADPDDNKTLIEMTDPARFICQGQLQPQY